MNASGVDMPWVIPRAEIGSIIICVMYFSQCCGSFVLLMNGSCKDRKELFWAIATARLVRNRIPATLATVSTHLKLQQDPQKI